MWPERHLKNKVNVVLLDSNLRSPAKGRREESSILLMLLDKVWGRGSCTTCAYSPPAAKKPSMPRPGLSPPARGTHMFILGLYL